MSPRTVAGCSALALFGAIGDGNPDEVIDSWQTAARPAGGDALRITETIDWDFGDSSRHGIFREIPNDFGAPTDVMASSPDAPDDLDVEDQGDQTVIKIGDPDTTISGQHRYTLSYTLPQAGLSSGSLDLDIIAGDEFDRNHFEAVIAGFDLTGEYCESQFNGATDECAIESGDGVYTATFEPLPAWTGVTVGGQISGTTGPVDVATPPVRPGAATSSASSSSSSLSPSDPSPPPSPGVV